MSIDLADYKAKTRAAVKRLWTGGKVGSRKKISGTMGGFADLVVDIVCANGLTKAHVLPHDRPVSLPGHFSATQSWDIVVVNEGRLIAAIKADFVLGPSLSAGAGCDYDKVLGRAMELKAVYRKGVFGETRKPFVGYLILLEDAPGSRKPVTDVSPNFPLFPEFKGASYAERYNILCKKLMAEELYTAAAVILSPRSASKSGAYSEMSDMTGLKSFVKTLAAHISAEATP